jgi:hypothetical protein
MEACTTHPPLTEHERNHAHLRIASEKIFGKILGNLFAGNLNFIDKEARKCQIGGADFGSSETRRQRMRRKFLHWGGPILVGLFLFGGAGPALAQLDQAGL